MFEYDNYDSATFDLIESIKKKKVMFFGDVVIIKPIEDMTERGFIITDKHTDSDVTTTFCRGEVIAMGRGKKAENGTIIEPDVKVGDIVLIPRAYLMREKIGDSYLYITKEKEIMAIED